jgi:hypothetical protein
VGKPFLLNAWRPTPPNGHYEPRSQCYFRVGPIDDFGQGPDYLIFKLRPRLLFSLYCGVRLPRVLAAHLKYLSYVIRHKVFVYRAGRKLGLGRWQLLVHDLSKFLPSEWFPYVYTFYLKQHVKTGELGYYHIPGELQAFDRAWLLHQKRNPHHWQYWVLIQDDEPTLALLMPAKYACEMVADWRGAGLAQGKDDLQAWYEAHKGKIVIHNVTRHTVEKLIEMLTHEEK